MTAIIPINRSLVVRRGEVLFAFNQFLDNRSRIQLQAMETGECLNMSMEVFYTRLRLAEFVVVSSSGEVPPTEPAQTIVDTTQLDQKEKEKLNFKLSVLAALRKLGISRGQRKEVEKALPRIVEGFNKKKLEKGDAPVETPSASAVMDWARRYGNAFQSVASLIDKNAHRRREGRLDDHIESRMTWALDNFYLTRDRFTLKHAFGKLSTKLQEDAKAGIIAPEIAKVAFATFHRRKEEVDPYLVDERRYGPGHARNKFRATIEGTRVTRPLERLEIDHTLLNWVVVCDRTGLPLGRPTLTIVIDSYSGYIVGVYISFNGPGIVSVLKAIKSSILPKDGVAAEAGCKHPWIAWGVGECIILDNGLEFHSTVFRHAAWELSMDIEYCAVRQPWLKPHVERALLDLDAIPVSEGRVFKAKANEIPIDPKGCAVTTLSRFARGIVLWAVDLHGQNPHSRWFAKPAEKFQDGILRSPAPTMPLTLAGLDLIAAMHKPLSVRNGGVELRGLSYAGPHLQELLKAAGGCHRTMIKWDPDDMGVAYAQHSLTREWVPLHCTRPDMANGLTWNQLLVIRKALRAAGDKDTVEQMMATRDRLRETWLEPLAVKNVSTDAPYAKRLAQITTAAVPPVDKAPLPSQLVTEEELVYDEQDIPEYQSAALY